MSWVDQASHLESTWTLALALENTWDQPGEHLDLDQPGEHLDLDQPGEHLGSTWRTPGEHQGTPGHWLWINWSESQYKPTLGEMWPKFGW